eukprot:378098-Karenia_brevis.AAC.1
MAMNFLDMPSNAPLDRTSGMATKEPFANPATASRAPFDAMARMAHWRDTPVLFDESKMA